MPVSLTAMRISVARRLVTVTSTSPLLGELDRVREQVEQDLPHALRVGHRLDGVVGHVDDEARDPCRRAGCRPRRRTRARAARRCTGARRTSMRPASAFARSSTSLMSESRCSPLRLMRSSDSRARGLSCSLRRRRASRSAKPRIALSGVRSSWLIDARNSVFTGSRASASRPARRACSLLSRRRSCVHALCRPTASWRAASRTSSSRSSDGALVRPRSTRARAPLRRRRSGCAEHPARCGALPTPRSSSRRELAERGRVEHRRLARVHHALRASPRRRRAPCSSARPSTEHACTGTRRSAPSSRIDDADVRAGEPHEPAKPGRRERGHVERLQLAHELGVRARRRRRARRAPRSRA